MLETDGIRMFARGRRAAIIVARSILFACAASAAGSWAEEPTLAPPSNDDCTGAIPIPPSSLPYLTAPVSLLEATAVGEPTLCYASAHTVWYTFTPTETASYEFTTCPGVAPAANLESAGLSVLAATGCAGAFTAVQCSEHDALCGEEFLQPRVTVSLTAGTVYYIVAGSVANPVQGRDTLQIRVSRAEPPANDTCAQPTPVTLNVPTPGTFALAMNSGYLPTDACYSLPAGPPAPVGQTYSSASGRDLMYAFTPDATGTYSFRVDPFGGGCCSNMVLYVTMDCLSPAGACIGAASRDPGSANWYGAEEVVCLPLQGGRTYYAYVDENVFGSYPMQFHLTVSRCVRKVEPNDTPDTAGSSASGVEGAIGTPNDVDYFSLGAPPAGTRVFTIADQAAGNTRGIQMRITNATSTLEFDDDDNAVFWGDVSPNIAGRALDGTPSYIQISPNSPTTVSEPYRLTYVLQPPGMGYGGSSASPSSEDAAPPDDNVSGNMFYSGEIAPEGDVDRFTFCAHAGDEIFASLDDDPLRDNTPFDGSLTLSNTRDVGFGFDNFNASSDNTPAIGSLTATTPNSPGDAMTWRARETGRHRINVHSAATGPAATGDYLLSIAVNGQIGAEQSVDLAITTTDFPDPVPTGSLLTHTVTVTNSGPNIALIATMIDPLPAGTTFDSLEGSGSGGSWTCALPAVGTNGTIRCENPCFEDTGSYTFTIRSRLDACLGNGTVLTNTLSIGSATAESNGGDNGAASNITVVDNGSCDDGSVCTTSDVCSGSACLGGLPLNCDDAQPCTTDSCDALLGCQNTPILLPAAVDDSLRVTKVGTDAEVGWTDSPGPFNVYRGSRAGADPWSYNHSCVAPRTEGPYTDAATPSEQELFYYLVSRENACGQESEVGHDSQGTPDPNPSPCSCSGVVCLPTESCHVGGSCIDGVCTYIDSDGDGVCDADDLCPTDPQKTEPGICGCDISDWDTDGDSVADCWDRCPADNPDDANNDGCCDSAICEGGGEG